MKYLEKRLDKFQADQANIIEDEKLEFVKDDIMSVTTKIKSFEEKLADLYAEQKQICDMKRNRQSRVKCDHCHTTYSNNIELKDNLITVNVQDKYNCQQCDLLFCSKWGLKEHMKNHTSDKKKKIVTTTTRVYITPLKCLDVNFCMLIQKHASLEVTVLNPCVHIDIQIKKTWSRGLRQAL